MCVYLSPSENIEYWSKITFEFSFRLEVLNVCLIWCDVWVNFRSNVHQKIMHCTADIKYWYIRAGLIVKSKSFIIVWINSHKTMWTNFLHFPLCIYIRSLTTLNALHSMLDALLERKNLQQLEHVLSTASHERQP